MTAKDIWGKKGICEKSRKVFNIVLGGSYTKRCLWCRLGCKSQVIIERHSRLKS